MKRILFIIALLIIPATTYTAQQILNNGDQNFTIRTKINENFTELYNAVSSFLSIPTGTDGYMKLVSNTITIDSIPKVNRIASGTVSLGTAAISSGTCATVVQAAAVGTLTTDVPDWIFNADPTGITGYMPSTSGMLTIIAYPTANNVNFKVCNNTSASITPGAVTLNWKVVR